MGRRLKLYRVPCNEILDILRWGTDPPQCMALLNRDAIPDGASVLSVHESPHCRSFIVTVEHESFEEVPDGSYIPYADEILEVSSYRLLRAGEALVSLEGATREQLTALRDAVNERLYDQQGAEPIPRPDGFVAPEMSQFREGVR